MFVQISSAGSPPSTVLFNTAGQPFSIPLHASQLQHMAQGTNVTAMFSPDGTQYFQPVTQITAQPAGPKIARTDRLEVCYLTEKIVFFSLFPLFLLILSLNQW